MFDNLNIEVLGIKIKFGKEDIMIISYYNPPDKMLSKELFTVIQDLKINYILLGDLNSKLTSIGCNKDNRNGIFLEEILNNNNCVIVNDKTHTYYPFHENYSCDILDLALCSSFLYKYIKEFVVLRESDMSSDHVITSNIAKIAEKLVALRLNEFLTKHHIIIKQQSGFRNCRQTKDNIFFITQKILEQFNRRKKICGIFFDIASAFDKVWH